MPRVSFLIDGFNLYHSVINASWKMGLRGRGTKWLDINSLLRSYLSSFGPRYKVEEIIYFSALAKHLEAGSPGKVERHETFIECLESTGIKKELYHFTKKPITNTEGKITITLNRYVEKQTDVAIAVRMLQLLFENKCDHIALVTGDTDLIPAIDTAKILFPKNEITCIFPFGVKVSANLKDAVDNIIRIRKEQYTNHQFPDPVVLPDKTIRAKPATW